MHPTWLLWVMFGFLAFAEETTVSENDLIIVRGPKCTTGQICNETFNEIHLDVDNKTECSCENGETGNYTNGYCICELGWTGTFCNESCLNGSIGLNCGEACNCTNETECNHINGSCICPPGYKGKMCNETCEEGFWGTNCSHNCSCPFCNHVNGLCWADSVGLEGSDLENRTLNGTQTSNNSDLCTCGKENTCNRNNESCSCSQEDMRTKCNETFKEIYLDVDNKTECSCENGGTRNYTNGYCTCELGMAESHLENRTFNGTETSNYHVLCECENELCSGNNGTCFCWPCNDTEIDYVTECSCENGGTCNDSNGFCICPPGYTGIDCEQICHPLKYGMNCNMTCDCKNGGLCNAVDGTCECVAGYSGRSCESKCDNITRNQNCSGDCQCEKVSNMCNATDGNCSLIDEKIGDKIIGVLSRLVSCFAENGKYLVILFVAVSVVVISLFLLRKYKKRNAAVVPLTNVSTERLATDFSFINRGVSDVGTYIGRNSFTCKISREVTSRF